jgi:hypothetical protein
MHNINATKQAYIILINLYYIIIYYIILYYYNLHYKYINLNN